MSTTPQEPGTVTPPAPGKPTWNEAEKRQAMKNWLIVLVVAVAAIWLILIGYVFFIAPITKAEVRSLEPTANLTVVLAPVLAAAAGVERMLETIFNILEGAWKTMIAYLGRGLRWLKNAENELIDSRQWLAEVSAVYNQKMRELRIDPKIPVDSLTTDLQAKITAAINLRTMAEERLADAEKSLSGATATDSYKSTKAVASIVLGLMLGVVVSALGSLQMFAMLGIAAVPPRVDVFITGLVIGTGSYPVHSLLGILQQGKDALDSAKSALSRAGIAKPQPAQQPAADKPAA
jgi:hypothetical protein